ncbi:laminin G domain-containing protein, partial [Patescibacteria group bacterium]|nr:laminin G domain-containing protein [Patescibacteria group bacterium]
SGASTFETTNGTFYFTQPGNWFPYSVNGSTDLYYIRGQLESGSFTTDPVESFVKTDILLFQYLSDITSEDQTFILSAAPIRQSRGSIQIDVPNRYRAIMNTGDTDDFINIYDRAENDTNPDKIFEDQSPRIEEGGTDYRLRWHNERITTILESTDTRVRIRVEGKLDTSAGGNYLDDDGGDDDLTVAVDYTFTSEGYFVNQEWDFKDGLGLDDPGAGRDGGLNFVFIGDDYIDAAQIDTILYGDGNTESSKATDGSFNSGTRYIVYQAQNNYQDILVGIPRGGWFDQGGATNDWYVDVSGSGAELVLARATNVTTSGVHYSKWFFQIHDQADLDTELEREGLINDFRNADDLDFVKNPALEFDGSNDFVEIPTAVSIANSNTYTVEGWFRDDSSTSSENYIYAEALTTSSTSFALLQMDDNGTAGNLVWSHRDDSSVRADLTTTGMNDDQWHHFAVVRSASSSFEMFVDGVSVDTDTNAPGTTTVDNIKIGAGDRSNEGPNKFFNGNIDDLRVWDDARTQDEIRDNMFGEISGSSANLVGYWRLNDASGQTVNDETSNNNDGTLGANSSAATDDPSWTLGYDNLTNGVGGGWSDAPGSPGLEFDGSGDYVDTADTPFDITGDFTVEAWVNRSTGGSVTRGVVSKRPTPSAGGGFSLSVGNAGEVYCQTDDGTSTTNSYTDQNIVTTTAGWQHLAAVRSGTSCTVYINGVDRTTTSGTHTTLTANNNNLRIGSSVSNDEYWYGLIDEVRVWDDARTATEIKDNMYTQIEPTYANLIGYWRLNENTGTTAHDETSNDNDGTITAALWRTGYVPDFYNEAEGVETILMNAPDNALDFDGSDDFVRVSAVNTLQITGDVSFGAWFKADTIGDNEAVIYVGGGAGETQADNELYMLRWDTASGNDLQYKHENGEGVNTIITFDANLSTDTWYHAMIVRDVSTNEVKLYVNGVQTGGTQTYTNDPTGGTNATLDIGSETLTDFFDGVIDDVRVYNVELTQSQIQDTIHGPLNGDEANLVGYWKFDEGTGQLALDSTSNHNDGTRGASSSSASDDPEWTTGIVPDSYNTIDFDIDGGSNVSTLVNGAVSAEAASITVDSTTDFPASGIAYIDGDKFSYVSVTATTFDRIPTLGELAVIGHADNTVVSLMNRHRPFYKIRGYRDTVEPSSITLEGTTLTSGTDYNTEIKPFTTSYFAQDLTWYNDMNEDLDADIGTSLTNSGCTFVPGKYGNGVECDVDGADITSDPITEGTDIEKEIGTIEFWMQPKYNHDDGNTHRILNITETETNRIRFAKDSSNRLAFVYTQGGTSVTYRITSSNYSWSAGDWVHLRYEWDDSEPTSTQQRIYINGVEPATHDDSGTDLDGSAMTMVTPKLLIGNITASGSNECNCIIDEFRIYNSDVALTKLSVGGDTGNSDEYLNDTTNDFTFDFNDDDANNRGEYVWIGSDSPFSGVNQVLATDGVGSSEDFDWEYWNGTGWSALAVYDQDSGAHSFTADGTFYFIPPGNWFKYSVNGSTDSYYIRGHLEGGSYTTDPIEDTIKTDILLLQYLADITGTDQTFVVVPENLWLWFGLAPILPLVLRRRGKKARVVVSH